MNESVIQETFTLPSHGRIYNCSVNENITLRSMTTEDELRRLSPSTKPYKTICDLIDNCMAQPCGISSYDMCMGDYQYLLYRLRTVTYGPEYPNISYCPYCGNENKSVHNLDEMPVKEWTDSCITSLEVTLPVSGKTVKLRYLTPRDMDDIEQQKFEFMKTNPECKLDMTMLFNLKKSIELIDNMHYDYAKLDYFLKKLPMRDTNILLQSITKLNDGIGVNTSFIEKCDNPACELEYQTSFRITQEFFRPTIQF